MKIAACADLHLGYRAYPQVRDGRNAREKDIEDSWLRVVEGICRADPDVVTIAGDLFHRSRVSTFALRAYLMGLLRLLTDTKAEIYVAQGNHECARSAEVLGPNEIGGHLAQIYPGRLYLCTFAHTFTHHRNYNVTVMPFSTGPAKRFKLPEKGDKPNILVIHEAIQAPGIPKFYAHEKCVHIDKLAKHFDVVAAGDLHDHRELENDEGCIAFYSGAIDAASNNIWAESYPKGWVLVDLEAKEARFHPVSTRPVLQLEAPKGMARTAEELNEYLAEELNEYLDGYNDAGKPAPIIRLTVPEFDPSERLAVDQRLVKELKRLCLHFELNLDFKGVREAREASVERKSLQAMAEEFFAGDRPAVRRQALGHIDERWVSGEEVA